MPCAAPPDAPGLIDSAWGRSTTAACTFARASPSSESSGWCAPNTRREHTQAQQRVQALAASQLVLACTQRASGLWRGLRTGLVWLSRRLAPSLPLPFSSPHARHLWSSLVQQTPHQTHQSTQPHQPHLASSISDGFCSPPTLPPASHARAHTHTHAHTHTPPLTVSLAPRPSRSFSWGWCSAWAASGTSASRRRMQGPPHLPATLPRASTASTSSLAACASRRLMRSATSGSCWWMSRIRASRRRKPLRL